MIKFTLVFSAFKDILSINKSLQFDQDKVTKNISYNQQDYC